jgi:hypothetical protein
MLVFVRAAEFNIKQSQRVTRLTGPRQRCKSVSESLRQQRELTSNIEDLVRRRQHVMRALLPSPIFETALSTSLHSMTTFFMHTESYICV